MAVRPPGPSSAPTPPAPQEDPYQLAKDLRISLGNVIKEIRDAKNSPHLVDSEKALGQLAKDLQQLHQLAQKARVVEA
jgi:hypothetical protein